MNAQRTNSIRRWISNVLFVVAAVLFAYVAYAYYQERQDSGSAVPTPQSIPGRAELKNVRDAIASEGVTVEYGRQTVRIDGITPVGQQLIVDGAPAYVFIFENPDARSAATSSLSAESLELLTPSGADAATGALAMAQGSNVLVVSDGASDEIQERITAGVERLP